MQITNMKKFYMWYDIEFYNPYSFYTYSSSGHRCCMIKMIPAYNSALILYDIASKICYIEFWARKFTQTSVFYNLTINYSVCVTQIGVRIRGFQKSAADIRTSLTFGGTIARRTVCQQSGQPWKTTVDRLTCG